MDLTELEEWCVSELNGMSKARITSILNGKPMLESSDTSESDDSGDRIATYRLNFIKNNISMYYIYVSL
jgi:intergrase/recombinase